MPAGRVRNLEYAWTERGGGPDALLLHGFTGSKESWSGLLPLLEGSFRLLAVDLPGHGESGLPPCLQRYRMEEAAQDLAELVRRLAGGPVHLLGYSMGGRLALYFALEYPELARSLALESASPGLEGAAEREARRASDATLADRILAQGMEAFTAEWERLPLFASQASLPEAARRELRLRRLQNRPEGLAGSLRGMGTGVQPSLWGRLAALQLRTLLVAGELDEKFCALNRRMAQEIPAARLEIVPGAGHSVHLEQPLVYAKLLHRFWSQEGDR